MHVQNNKTLSSKVNLQKLFVHLYEEFDATELSSFLMLPEKKCDALRRAGSTALEDFLTVADRLQLSYGNFALGILDYQSVISTIRDEKKSSSRYFTSNYSSLMNSDSILKNCPERIKDDALRFLQVSGELYDMGSEGKKVSTLMNSDLLEYLSAIHYFSGQDIYQLGAASGFYNSNLAFGKSFRGLSKKESFARVIEEITRHFETSFDYELVKLTNDKVVIQKRLSEKMKDELKTQMYSNKFLTRYIQGSFSAISFYSTGQFAHTKLEKCQFDGDNYCEFHIDLNDLRPFSSLSLQ